MSDMVCRKSMMRCQTPGMCSPHGGCRDEVTTAKDRQISALIAENERLTNSLHEAREDRNKLGDRYDAVNAEVAGLRTGYEAYERVNAELKAEVDGLRKSLLDAAEEIDAWGSYASDYFQEKHDLAGCVAKFHAAAMGKGEQS